MSDSTDRFFSCGVSNRRLPPGSICVRQSGQPGGGHRLRPRCPRCQPHSHRVPQSPVRLSPDPCSWDTVQRALAAPSLPGVPQSWCIANNQSCAWPSLHWPISFIDRPLPRVPNPVAFHPIVSLIHRLPRPQYSYVVRPHSPYTIPSVSGLTHHVPSRMSGETHHVPSHLCPIKPIVYQFCVVSQTHRVPDWVLLRPISIRVPALCHRVPDPPCQYQPYDNVPHTHRVSGPAPCHRVPDHRVSTSPVSSCPRPPCQYQPRVTVSQTTVSVPAPCHRVPDHRVSTSPMSLCPRPPCQYQPRVIVSQTHRVSTSTVSSCPRPPCQYQHRVIMS